MFLDDISHIENWQVYYIKLSLDGLPINVSKGIVFFEWVEHYKTLSTFKISIDPL